MNEFIFTDLSPGVQLLAALLAGLGTSVTPCVYPLIPITLALFGASSEQSYLRAFFLSTCYVLGIALTYTSLGLFAAATGSVFGGFLSNPIVIALVAIFLILLSLFSLDLLRFGFLSRLQTRASQLGGKGAGGALIMGGASGIVAGPCVGPILVLILAQAAQAENVAWGGLLLFVYALGLGFPYLILGTFSGLITRLPKSGSWLHAVKFFTAAALLVFAQFFAWPLLTRYIEIGSISLAPELLAGIGLSALVLAYLAYRLERNWLKLIAALLLALVVSPATLLKAPPVELNWMTSLDSAKAEAAKQNRIIMVDLFAEWCFACKELEKITFADEEVKHTLSRFALVRVDLTTPDEAGDRLLRDYEVPGLPCLLFLRADGSEITGSRITGFLDPGPFLNKLRWVLMQVEPGAIPNRNAAERH